MTRTRKVLLGAITALAVGLSAAPAFADGPRGHWHGGGWYGGPRWGMSLNFGIPLGYPYWGSPYYYGPYAYPPVVYPPVVAAPAAPPVYIEREDAAPAAPPAPPAPAAPAGNWWYWCGSAQGYYPYVQSCPEGWRRVAPQP